MLVSINIVTYNEEDNIEKSLSSAINQSYRPIEIFLIDNASEDKTLERARDVYEKSDKMVPFSVINNSANLGFAGGHNIGFRNSSGDAVLCLNADCELDKNYVKYAVAVLSGNNDIGALQGKLTNSKSGNIDTAGLLIFKNRRVVNRGQGEKDSGKYDTPEEIWGVDGAAPVYRRDALEDTKISIDFRAGSREVGESPRYEYFDEDFFAYKEDIDLSWRMRLAGWRIYYEPKAIARHDRSAGESSTKNLLKIISARKKVSDFAKYHSFANQRLMQIKNERPYLFLKYSHLILIKEIMSWPYVIMFENYGIKSVGKFLKFFSKMLQKRKFVMAKNRISDKEMEKWFV